MEKRTLIALVERTGTGYSAYFPDITETITTTGETIAELRENLKEALELYVEVAEDRGLKVAHLKAEVELRLDVQQFFEFFSALNVSGFAQYTGINRSLLAQYAKGLKKPSEKQSMKILSGIHALAKDYEAVQF